MGVAPRALIWLLLAPSGLLAQLQLYLVADPADRLVEGSLDLGTVEVGLWQATSFRVRNLGAAPARLDNLSVAGTGFSLSGSAPLPLPLDPGAALSFTVRFAPAAPGNHSAFLSLNNQLVLLRAVAAPAPVVSLEHEGRLYLLSTFTSTDFGSVEKGSTSARRFWLENQTQDPFEVTVTSPHPAFRGPVGLDSPVTLEPGRPLAFAVIFEPRAAGEHLGYLKVNQRSFPMKGTGLVTFPKLQLLFDPPQVASGRKLWLTARLAAPAPEACTGVAGLDFISHLLSRADDPAIAFLAAGPSRWETIQVSPGEDTARFGAERGIWLYTGTTVGRIGITVKLCGQEAWAGLEIRPAPVVIEALQATRREGALELTLTGFDNTRTASQIAFSFFDSAGAPVAPGRVALDATGEFRRYFESPAQGGIFALRAAFPVTGDGSAIATAEVEITNSAGVTRSERTPVRP